MLWRTWPRNAWHRLDRSYGASGSLVGHPELGGFHGQGRAGHLHQVTTERAIVAQKGADPDQALPAHDGRHGAGAVLEDRHERDDARLDEVGAGQPRRRREELPRAAEPRARDAAGDSTGLGAAGLLGAGS